MHLDILISGALHAVASPRAIPADLAAAIAATPLGELLAVHAGRAVPSTMPANSSQRPELAWILRESALNQREQDPTWIERTALQLYTPKTHLEAKGNTPSGTAQIYPLWPAHLHLARDHLILADPASLALSPNELQALREPIEASLRELGCELIGEVNNAHGTAWLLHRAEAWQLSCPPLSATIGQNLFEHQPQGPDARTWRRLQNEIQMLWHDHPVNQKRVEVGLLPVNSVVIGGGAPACAPVLELPWHTITGEDAITETLQTFTAQVQSREQRRELIVCPPLPAVRTPDEFEAWLQAWQGHWNAEVCDTITQALNRKQAVSLHFVSRTECQSIPFPNPKIWQRLWPFQRRHSVADWLFSNNPV